MHLRYELQPFYLLVPFYFNGNAFLVFYYSILCNNMSIIFFIFLFILIFSSKIYKKSPKHKCFGDSAFCTNYLFENCGALLAFLRPYFFLSFILGSLVRNPAFFKAALNSSSAFNSALEIPCLIAPAWPVNPPP